MTTVVRPWATTLMALLTLASVAKSRLEVASSSKRIAGSTSSARARAISWRWPVDNDLPLSLTRCKYPPASPATSSCAPTARAAASTSASVASGLP